MHEVDRIIFPSATALDLAGLPEVGLSPNALEAHKIVGFNPSDVRARAFTLLRTRVIKEMASRGHRLLGITSPTPSSGKSFLAINLAASLARVAEAKVVLVDLDLRRGSVAAELGLPEGQRGIADFLGGSGANLTDLGFRIGGTNLAVFPTTPVSGSAAELLAHEGFSQFIAAFRDEKSRPIVIFDLPPVFAGDDAMLSVGALDSYLMVVDSGKTSRRHLEDALAMLTPTPCLGSVLNRFKGGLLDAYGYGMNSKMYDKYYA